MIGLIPRFLLISQKLFVTYKITTWKNYYVFLFTYFTPLLPFISMLSSVLQLHRKPVLEDIWVKLLANLLHAILRKKDFHRSCFTMKLQDIRKHVTGCGLWCEISRKSYKYFHLLRRTHHEQYAVLLSAHRRRHSSSNSYHSFFRWKHIRESKWMGILSHIFPLFLNIRKNLLELHLRLNLSLYYWKKTPEEFRGGSFLIQLAVAFQ